MLSNPLMFNSAVAVTASRSQRFEVHLAAGESAAALAAGEVPPSYDAVAAAAAAVPPAGRVLAEQLRRFHGFVRLSEQKSSATM